MTETPPHFLFLANLKELFGRNTSFKMLRLKDGYKTTVPERKNWLVLSGYIGHITGTDTVVSAYTQGGEHLIWQTSIPTGTANSQGSLFNTVPTAAAKLASQWSPIFVPSNGYISFAGGAGALANIMILEWDVVTY